MITYVDQIQDVSVYFIVPLVLVIQICSYSKKVKEVS